MKKWEPSVVIETHFFNIVITIIRLILRLRLLCGKPVHVLQLHVQPVRMQGGLQEIRWL